jgi:Domain of unknown function (DUF929)
MAKAKRAPTRTSASASASGSARTGEAGGTTRQADKSRPRAGSRSGPPSRGQRNRGRGPSGPSRSLLTLLGAVFLVIVVVVVLVVVKVTSSSNSSTRTAVSPDVLHAVTNVSASALEAAGYDASQIESPATPVSSSTRLTSDGKPELLWMGAEYCPYCAADRWSVVVALSRFGTFSNLHQTTSSSTDTYPNTPTFSFYQSGYSSPYLAFVPVEMTTNNQNVVLQTPTPAEQTLINKYDVTPYVKGAQPGTDPIPFLDFANRYIIGGPPYSPALLQGLSMGTIAGSLSDPANEPSGKAIDQGANQYSGVICRLTGNQPASVCSLPAVKKAEASLG